MSLTSYQAFILLTIINNGEIELQLLHDYLNFIKINKICNQKIRIYNLKKKFKVFPKNAKD